MNLYSVYDAGAKEYGPPMVAKNDAIATRLYLQSMAKVDPAIKGDFDLYHIGMFDPEDGGLCPITPNVVTLAMRKLADLTEVEAGQ